jgi:hypothetical protein
MPVKMEERHLKAFKSLLEQEFNTRAVRQEIFDHLEEQVRGARKVDHVGIHVHRLRLDQNNPRENAFAEEWAQENRRSDLLRELMLVGSYSPLVSVHDTRVPAFRITQRDATIVATVVQWLGSNIGLSFLEESLKRVGYHIGWPPRK